MFKKKLSIFVDTEMAEKLKRTVPSVSQYIEYLVRADWDKIEGSIESEKTGLVPVSKDFMDWVQSTDLYKDF